MSLESCLILLIMTNYQIYKQHKMTDAKLEIEVTDDGRRIFSFDVDF